MSMRSQNMLIANGELDQVGPATRGDGYYGYADGLHTVGFYLNRFIGRIYVDASLSDNPGDNDWFPIALGDLEYMDFDTPTTGIETFNVIGNFVYLRAKIKRSHLSNLVGATGTCQKVTLSL
jgi:hypothetical protein